MHKLTPEGLQGVLDVPLYGRIAALQLFRPVGEPRDLLLVLTERNKFCVLAFDEESGGCCLMGACSVSLAAPAPDCLSSCIPSSQGSWH